jgi:large subunit ribosomal protein L28
MSKVIKIGNQKPSSGNNVSHSKRRTKRTFKPNLVTKKIEINGVTHKVSMSARLMKGFTKPAVKRTKRVVVETPTA